MLLAKGWIPRIVVLLWMAFLVSNAVPLHAARPPFSFSLLEQTDLHVQNCACTACAHGDACCCKSAPDPLSSAVLRAVCDRGENPAAASHAPMPVLAPLSALSLPLPTGHRLVLPAYRGGLSAIVSSPLAPPPRFL